MAQKYEVNLVIKEDKLKKEFYSFSIVLVVLEKCFLNK